MRGTTTGTWVRDNGGMAFVPDNPNPPGIVDLPKPPRTSRRKAAANGAANGAPKAKKKKKKKRTRGGDATAGRGPNTRTAAHSGNLEARVRRLETGHARHEKRLDAQGGFIARLVNGVRHAYGMSSLKNPLASRPAKALPFGPKKKAKKKAKKKKTAA